MRRVDLTVGSATARPGTVAVGELPIARQITGTSIALPIRLVHGRSDGPTIWLSAAVHGDEIAGIEIIRRVLDVVSPAELSGSIIAVPIVNVHGFLNGDRYLPDRRDLNRSFPGSAKGSLAGRIAHLFTREIVERSDVGIDLHTGSDHRTNLPQVRADLDDPGTFELAQAFGAPVNLHARLRDGSLRETAVQRSARVLLFEGGEANRFHEDTIRVAVDGVLRVLQQLEMLDRSLVPPAAPPVECRESRWARARRSGICSLDVELGAEVEQGAPLGRIRDAQGTVVATPRSPLDGIVIGHSQHPLVNQGDAVVHVARPVVPSIAKPAPTAKEPLA